jgi:DNA repair photolyase
MKKIANPPNPFDSVHRELLEPPTDARLEIYEDASRTILSKNDSPDVGFTWSVNPYRGCFHSCAYCYARRYHEYLDMGAGTDFESKLVIKKEAPALLRREFLKKSWKGDTVVFSGGTDCYQPIEAVYQLTRGCLEVCLDFHNPAAIITKSFLVTRDLDLLTQLHRQAGVSVTISISFSSDDMARKIEPQASTIERRFKALEMFAKAGIPTGVSLAPTIPGLNENDIPIVMKRAKECGARFAFHSIVRLSGSVKDVFEEKIRAALPPERVERILKRIHESRGGKMNDTRFGHRMQGVGTYWKAVEDLFQLSQKKFGLDDFPNLRDPSPFRVPSPQLELPLFR